LNTPFTAILKKIIQFRGIEEFNSDVSCLSRVTRRSPEIDLTDHHL